MNNAGLDTAHYYYSTSFLSTIYWADFLSYNLLWRKS